MLDAIKNSLRLSNDCLLPEIMRNITSALLELGRVGVNVDGIDCYSANPDKLIVKACELYCKWQMDYMGRGEEFRKSFCDTRDSLSVTSQYTNHIKV